MTEDRVNITDYIQGPYGWYFWGLDDRFYGPFFAREDAIKRKKEVDDNIPC